MYEIQSIPVSELLLDEENARLLTDPSNQQETAEQLAAQQPDKFVRLAEDIARRGTDPLSLTAVVPVNDGKDGYRMLEGNRRVLALQALDTPELVTPFLGRALGRRLVKAAEAFAENPTSALLCVVFERDDDEAHQWIRLRHRGEQRGVGVVPWDANEANKYDAKHGASRNPAGQVLDFIEKHGTLSSEAQTSSHSAFTNLERLLRNTDTRRSLGVDIQNQRVIALKDREWIARVWSAIVDDLKTGETRVGDLYRTRDQAKYVKGVLRRVGAAPRSTPRRTSSLDDWTHGRTSDIPQRPRPRPRRPQARRTVVPRGGPFIGVSSPRVRKVYEELRTLDTERYTNAASVLLRVFLELSLTEFIERTRICSEDDVLRKRLRETATYLCARSEISSDLKKAIHTLAQRNGSMTSVPVMHLYVHNPYLFPRSADLFEAWDGVAPFLQKVWDHIAAFDAATAQQAA